MTTPHCGICKHYKCARNPETNRPLPSMPGECTYPVILPVIPLAYYEWDTWRHEWKSLRLTQHRMYRDDGAKCPCFEAVKAAKNKSEQIGLPLQKEN